MRAAAVMLLAGLAVPADGALEMLYGQAGTGRQVVTADEIRASGITRLGEIPLLLHDWDAGTVNGFTWWASPRGLTWPGRSGWTIMVDGQVLEVGVLGVQDLNRLPLRLSAVDSLVAWARPGLRAGRFADTGLLHFHTTPPADGLSVRGGLSVGNETGDPGPFRFTGLDSPNVDRDPTDPWGAVTYSESNLRLEVDGARHKFLPTDPALRRRLTRTIGQLPALEAVVASAGVRIQALGGTHRIAVDYSEFDDLFLPEPLGREVPTTTERNSVGLDGTLAADGGSTVLDYRFGYTRQRLGRRPNPLALDFDWEEQRWVGGARGSFGDGRLRAGGSLERVETVTQVELTDADYSLGRLHADVSLLPSGPVRSWLGALVATAGDGLALNGELGAHWTPDGRSMVEATLTYAERLPEEDGRIWYWVRRGYDFLERVGVPVEIDGPEGETRVLASDLAGTLSLHRLRIRASLHHRVFRGLELVDQTFEFVPADRSFTGPVRLVADQGGSVGGFGIGLSSEAIPRLQFGAHYGFQDVLGGDAVFRDAWAALPRHRARIKVHFTPVPDFGIWGALRARSSTYWTAYRNVGGQSDGLYRAGVDGHAAVDLAFEKWLWDRRIRANLLLRNLTNESVRYHPAGASLDLALLLQVELRLDSIWAAG